MDEKETLHHYLRVRRDNLLGKLDGLSEYDVRRPLTPTGTNLLGLVKHVSSVELDYFGEVFGRPSGRRLPWYDDDASPDADMWAAVGETRDDIVKLHRFAAAHSDATIEALPLDAAGVVQWWPEERRHVTLHQILVHMVAESAHHLGHADILRELIDGTAGQRPGDPNLSPRRPGRMGGPPGCHRGCCEASMSTRDVPAQIGDLPPIGRPANSALLQAGITSLTEVASLGRRELLAMHGVGPKALRILEAAADERGLVFAP